jgi:hypothetical protein
VENGSSYSSQIDSVKLLLGHDDDFEACNVKYDNGKFTLNLPVNVPNPNEALGALPSRYSRYDGLTVSDLSVKIGYSILYAYKNGHPVGSFYHKAGEWKGELIYVNGDVSVTGTATETGKDNSVTGKYTYNINAKKGWNILYRRDTGSETEYTTEETTEAPAGAKWVYNQ